MTSRRLANEVVAKAVFTFLLALLVVALSSPDLREFFDDLAPVVDGRMQVGVAGTRMTSVGVVCPCRASASRPQLGSEPAS